MSKVIRSRGLSSPHPEYRVRIWESPDLDALALALAELVLGQWRHVEELLRSSNALKASNADYAIESAIASLTLKPNEAPYHRDGWIFQFISWIAAVEGNPLAVRSPHMEKAQKGFDGLQLEATGTSTGEYRLVISEDKATDNPRKVVRDDIWPSFDDIEAGNRHSALAAELGSLLRSRPELNSEATVTAAADRIMRDPQGLAYRIAITAGDQHSKHPQLGGLFDGFTTHVVGDRDRRLANIFVVDDVRAWMGDIAARAIAVLEERLPCTTP